jgi:hypothetical protein
MQALGFRGNSHVTLLTLCDGNHGARQGDSISAPARVNAALTFGRAARDRYNRHQQAVPAVTWMGLFAEWRQMREKPPIKIGLIAAAVIGVALAGVHIVLLRTIQSQPIGPGLAFAGALLVLALVFLGLWLYGLIELLTLGYQVDRNGVEIRTASARQTIPHAAIERIEYGESAGAPGRIQGIAWPGYMRGIVSAPPFGRIAVWATEPLQRQLILVTGEMCYAISPADRSGFVQRYLARRELGALESLPQLLTPIGIASWSIWRDRVFWLAMAMGLALNAAMAALTLVRYSTLPAIIPLHWNALGQPDRLAAKASVFAIPAIGGAVLLSNLALAVALHRGERLGARLLAWGSIGVQIALWAAAWQVLGP